MKSNPKKMIKKKVGGFTLEFRAAGLYAVRFPVMQRGQAYSDCLSPLFQKLKRAKVDLEGYTDFQKRVYKALRKVPAGKVIAYGELAKRAGYPGAARAVGSAMKKNRLPLVIPCHRVVPSSGGIGDYAQGKRWKKWLLEHEQHSRTTRNGQCST